MSLGTVENDDNPYIGPHPLTATQPIFGRKREIRELEYLLTAERIVLLHSPSGAGKSSLLNAKGGLLEKMQERFYVWPVTRVNTAPEGPVANRFVWSAITGLEEKVPAERRLGDLSQMTLQEFVARRARRPDGPKNVLLVFDQFEEVVRLNPQNVAEKQEFFRQLGELLHNSEIWALFVLREDFLAALDPYRRLIPAHLRNRYRIDLLQGEEARKAIQGPAEGKREFTDAAAERLVADLSTVQVQQPDGSFQKEQGPYVEPMQLQVACRNLWEQMPAHDRVIDPEDVEKFGNVTGALAAYYNTRMQQDDQNRERLTRQWVGTKLITADGIRGQVRKGVERSEGLPNEWIKALEAAHLVRPEPRGGAIWFELAHDRLVAPVQASNAEWFETRLSPLQRRADLWEAQARGEGLLACRAELTAMREWALGKELTQSESDFLAASGKRERSAVVQRRMLVSSAVLGLVALVACGVAWGYAREIEGYLSESKKQVEEFTKLNQDLEREKVLSIEAAKARTVALEAAEVARKKAEAETQRAEKSIAQIYDERAEVAWRDGAYEMAWLNNMKIVGKDHPASLGRLLLPERWPNENWRIDKDQRMERLADPRKTPATVVAVSPLGLYFNQPHQTIQVAPTADGKGHSYREVGWSNRRSTYATSPEFFALSEEKDPRFEKRFNGRFAVAMRPSGEPLLVGDKWVIAIRNDRSKAFLQAEERLTAVAPAVKEGFAVLDAKGRVRFGNRAMEWASAALSTGRTDAVSLGVETSRGKLVAVGTRDGLVALYNRLPERLEPVGSVAAFDAGVGVAQLHFLERWPNLIVAGGESGELAILAIEEGQALRRVTTAKAHEGAVTHLGEIEGELVSAGLDGVVRRIPLAFEGLGVPISLPELFLRPSAPEQVKMLAKLAEKSRTLFPEAKLTNREAVTEARIRYFGYEPPLQAFQFRAGLFRPGPVPGEWTWISGDQKARLQELRRSGDLIFLRTAGGSVLRVPQPGSAPGQRIGIAPGTEQTFFEFAWTAPPDPLDSKDISYGSVVLSRVSGRYWQLTDGVRTMPPNIYVSKILRNGTLEFIDATRFFSVKVPREGGAVSLGFGNEDTTVFALLRGERVASIPTPITVDYLKRKMTYAEVKLNGGGNVAVVRPGETIRMSARWRVEINDAATDAYCPGCSVQFNLGLWNVATKSGFSDCLLSSNMAAGSFPGRSGLFDKEFNAPMEPGLHWITSEGDLLYNCASKPERHIGRPEAAIAALFVEKADQ